MADDQQQRFCGCGRCSVPTDLPPGYKWSCNCGAAWFVANPMPHPDAERVTEADVSVAQAIIRREQRIDELEADIRKHRVLKESLEAERDGLRAARMAYASEFPLNADGESDVGSIHANIRALKAERDAALAQLAEARVDAERLGWLARQGDFSAYSVPSDPHDYELYLIDQGPWPDGIRFKGENLRECIDAARTKAEGADHG